MRLTLISLAAAASALAVATPAAAQWYPQQHRYGVHYGNQQSQHRAAMHQRRIDQIQRQIRQLDRRNVLSNREARRLYQESVQVERQLRGSATYGLSRREDAIVQRQIARLEQRLFRHARDGNRYGQQYSGYDRDRDGRDDRYEDDRGYRRH